MSILHRKKPNTLDNGAPQPSAQNTQANPALLNSPAQGSGGRRRKPAGPIRRLLNGWWDRLLGAVSEGSLSQQDEQYASHRTSRDFIWNTIGFASWSMVFPLLTIVATQAVGAEQAGMFSLAFVTGTLLMYLANYGVRAYQISDINERHSFTEYQINRVITCIAMVLVGIAYCSFRGYADEMLTISMGIYVYKMVDGLADAYEGRLQQVDKLYLAGVSQTIRSVFVLVVSCLVLLIFRNLGWASVSMAVVAVVSFLFVTFPLALLETPRSNRHSFSSVVELFKQCFPLFVALFLYALVDNMPKFAMEGVLSYDNQLYFNALYFPAQAILIVAGFIYKPLMVRMANAWADASRRKKFDLFIIAMLAIIVALTLVFMVIMNWVGIPVMSFLYGLDFEQFRDLCIIMLVAGGVTAGIDFLYQVITILRRQNVVTKLYLVTFFFSLMILLLLINITGLPGAVIGYLIVMTILLVLLLWQYVTVRIEYTRHPEDDEAALALEEALRQSNERQRVEKVREGLRRPAPGEPASARQRLAARLRENKDDDTGSSRGRHGR